MRRTRVTIGSIAAGGDGVAREDGLVIFVPRTAPGDEAEVDVSVRGRLARGVVRRLLTPSPARVDPPCAHYTRDQCGGCQLQHLQYAAQLEAKSGIVRDAVRRIGQRGRNAVPIAPSPAPWRYRTKLTLALRRVNGRWIAGLHPYNAPGTVFALRDCLITDARVVAAWQDVMAAADHLPRRAELRGAVRRDGDQLAFLLEGGERWPRSAAFFERVPSLAALWWRPEARDALKLHERGATDRPAVSFAQVNNAVASAVRTHAVARVMAHAPRTVVDAYAGVGDSALELAARGCAVVAIEMDAAAAACCADRLPRGCRSVAARVEDALAAALPADAVLLNPPRAGLDAQVSRLLEAAEPRPRAVVYTSCDPATLARDLRRMPGWRIASLQAFDMFPQTAHVETVCELVPERA